MICPKASATQPTGQFSCSPDEFALVGQYWLYGAFWPHVVSSRGCTLGLYSGPGATSCADAPTHMANNATNAVIVLFSIYVLSSIADKTWVF